MKIYIAAPLFSQAEKEFNLLVDQVLRGLGLDTYLPQRDAGEAASQIRAGGDEHVIRQRLFEADYAAVLACDLFLLVLDGRVPDEGACFELGVAHANGKPCFGLQTDVRRFGGTDTNNLMIDYALRGGTSRSLDELATALRDRIDDGRVRLSADEEALGAGNGPTAGEGQSR
jgi:nucleoside 2-deoxyribosyltransferase